MRGVIPAIVLRSLEQHAGKICREIFSYVAGTSTGSLIAACVAAGVPAEKIVEVYQKRAAEIFPDTGLGPAWADFRLTTAGHRYELAPLRKVISDTLGTAVSWSLNDSPVDLLITAKGQDQHAYYFVKANPKNSGKYGEVSLLDACVASSAAITYFPFVSIQGVNSALTDGGLGVSGDPILVALVEAFYYNSYKQEELSVISLGTGVAPAWGPSGNLVSEVSWLVDTVLDSIEAEQPKIARRWFKDLKKFTEIDTNLPSRISMSDAKMVPTLSRIGEDLVKTLDWDQILSDPAPVVPTL